MPKLPTTQPYESIPPYRRGPHLGALWEFGTSNAWDVSARLARDVGPLCRVSVMGQKMLLMNDPDAIAEVLMEPSAAFPKGAPGPALRPVASNASMFIQPGGDAWRKAHDANPMLPAMQDGWLSGVIPPLQRLVEARATEWTRTTPDAPIADTFDALRHLAFDAFSQCLFGTGFDQGVYDEFVSISNWLDSRIKWPLPMQPPVLPWRKARNQAMAARLEEVVVRRRALGASDEPDLLAWTIRHGSTEEPATLASQLFNLYCGGAFSMSTAVAATLYELGRRKDVRKTVQTAVDGLLQRGPLTLEGLLACGPLQAAIRETMRLKPPVAIFLRRVAGKGQATIRGYEIPDGTKLLISCKHLHVSPLHWSEPLHFRLSRWDDPAANPLGSSHYFPFGRGPRACYGQDFAMAYISLVVAVLLGRTDPQVGAQQPWLEGFWFGCMFPKKLSSRFQIRSFEVPAPEAQEPETATRGA